MRASHLVVASVLSLSACGGAPPEIERTDPSEPVAFVVEGTVGTYGELRLGAADVGRAAVYVMLDGPDSLINATLRVGEPVEHDGYTVELLEIDAGTAYFRVVDPDGEPLG